MDNYEVYVIFEGPDKGIYHSWEECKKHTDYKPHRHKGFNNVEMAKMALEIGYNAYDEYRKNPPKIIPPDLW